MVSDLESARRFELHGLSAVFEIFPSPITRTIKSSEIKIKTPDQLFLSSNEFGQRPFFIHQSAHIEAVIDGREAVISSNDFLRWQIKRLTSIELYKLINKVEHQLDQIFDFDAEYARDEQYSPEEWLSFFYPNLKDKGISFIERLKTEKPREFEDELIKCFLDEDTGLCTWLETEVDDALKCLKKYNDWDQPLSIVSLGKFNLIKEANSSDLTIESYRLSSMYIRNYDEGDID